jgi:DNA-binding CsgD family transcriptional regulator
LYFKKQFIIIVYMDTSKSYILLLIDIKKSTQIPSVHRNKAFDKLLTRLPKLNQALNPPPVLGLSLNYGDEIAGLFERPTSVFHAISEIRDLLHPDIAIRFVVLRGTIGNDSKNITQVGGEVFKRANKTMTKIKKRNRYCHWDTGQGLLDEILISLSELSNTMLENMTPYQREVYKLFKQGYSQKGITVRLKKHQQSVSEAVRRSNAEQVIDAEDRIHRILKSPFNQSL